MKNSWPTLYLRKVSKFSQWSYQKLLGDKIVLYFVKKIDQIFPNLQHLITWYIGINE